jgi:hypothetical protein
MKHILSFVVLLGTLASASAQCNIYLQDGSFVKQVILLEEKIEIQTGYGILAVPTSDISNIKLGFRYPPGKKEEVDVSIKNLGNDVFKIRDEADTKLIKLGKISYLALKKTNSADMEVLQRRDKIIARIERDVPNLRFDEDDLMITKKFQIKGKLVKDSIKMKTAHFGSLDMHLSSIDKITMALAFDVGFKVKGGSEWVDTDIDLLANDKIDITANGMLDLWFQAPGQHMCDPDGHTSMASSYKAGVLLGKVNNEVFVIGKTSSVTGKTGKLYLKTNGSPWGTAIVDGFYDVQIKRGN